jgi:hypothetical protein
MFPDPKKYMRWHDMHFSPRYCLKHRLWAYVLFCASTLPLFGALCVSKNRTHKFIRLAIGRHLCASKNSIIIPNIGTLALVSIPIGMHLAHIVSINSLAIINFPFETHLVFHLPIGTLVMAYVSFQTCLALAIVYIFIKMCLAFHVPFETVVMA